MLLLCLAVVVIIAGFWYRAQRIRIFRWRLGIESTVCVGIIRPGEKVLRRVGSGCLVENAWGEVGCLTNWHVFREIKSIPLQQQSRVEVLKKNVEGRDFIKDFTVPMVRGRAFPDLASGETPRSSSSQGPLVWGPASRTLS